MIEQLQEWVVTQGLSETTAEYVSYIIAAIAVLMLSWLANFIAKRILLSVISFIIKQTKTKWDDVLLERKVFVRLSHIAPALIIHATAAWFGALSMIIQRLSVVYMMIAGLAALFSFITALVDIYNTFAVARQHPLKGYAQVLKIILSIVIGIVAISTLLDRSPLLLLSGLGAMTAVLILVFKDSILGLVASIQLSMNRMVQVGDWIEMPKYGADGDVIDITLLTVKVQNWDKTITTIPSYSLISDAFKNWRGMSESGGRRIKRSVFIDMGTVRFLDQEMLDKYENIQLLKKYLTRKKTEIAEHNQKNNIDTTSLINGRHLTNIGTFRAYLEAYLRNHPKIHNDMTFLVRQLQLNEKGLPIEIYVFSNDQVWANYEAIQADIFDHILAIIPFFELRVYQYPGSGDLMNLYMANKSI